ncbi:MAG: hypothetical protein AB7G13_22355 [Lautropia sp.]
MPPRPESAGLPRAEVDAMRECVRILAADATPEMRAIMSRNAENYIAQGKWIPAFTLEHFAQLFYAADESRAREFLTVVRAAADSGELPCGTPGRVLASEVAAWAECPQVPQNSPLRLWLPTWMHEGSSGHSESSSTVEHAQAPADLPKQRWPAQEDVVLGLVRELGFDPERLPKALPGKGGVKAQVRDLAKDRHRQLFEGRVFEKAWDRLRKDGRIADG